MKSYRSSSASYLSAAHFLFIVTLIDSFVEKRAVWGFRRLNLWPVQSQAYVGKDTVSRCFYESGCSALANADQGDSFSQHTRFLGHFCNFAFILHFPLDEVVAISLLLLLMAVNERSTGRGLASKAATWPQKSSSVVVLAVRTVGRFNIGGNPPGLKLLFMAVFHFALGSPCKASSVQRETRRWPRGKKWKKEERKQTRASDLGVAPS